MNVIEYLEGREPLPTGEIQLNRLSNVYHDLFVNDLRNRPFNEDEANRWIAFMKILNDNQLHTHMQQLFLYINDKTIEHEWSLYFIDPNSDRGAFFFDMLKRKRLPGY